MEGVAKHERHRLEQEKQGLQIDTYKIKERLKEARVLERIHPYLRRDGVRREVTIDPVQTRASRNKQIEARRERQSRHTCPFCQEKGHYRNQCLTPHRFCATKNEGTCVLPLSHPHWVDDRPISCPYEGRKAPPRSPSSYSFNMPGDEEDTITRT
jgi:hypothetical protein